MLSIEREPKCETLSSTCTRNSIYRGIKKKLNFIGSNLTHSLLIFAKLFLVTQKHEQTYTCTYSLFGQRKKELKKSEQEKKKKLHKVAVHVKLFSRAPAILFL